MTPPTIRVVHTLLDGPAMMHSAAKPYAVVVMQDGRLVRCIGRFKTFRGAAKRAAAERIYLSA